MKYNIGAFMRMVVGTATAAAAPVTGPASWDPLWYWDAALGTTIATGVSQWDDQVSGVRFEQGAGVDQPTLSVTDADWNAQDALTFDLGDDLNLNTTDVPLAEQRFFHDGTSDWFIAWPVRHDETISKGALDTTADLTGAGLRLQLRGGGNNCALRIRNGTADRGLLQFPQPNAETLLFVKYEVATDTFSAKFDGGSWSSVVCSGAKATGDGGQSLNIGDTALETPFLFVSKTIPDAARQEEMLSYFLDRYVATWPTGVVGAYTPEDVTLSGSDVTQLNDQTGSGNHITDSTATTRPALDTVTYGAPVLDFDGVDEYLNLPSAFNSGISGGEDLPWSILAGLRPETAGRALLLAGGSTFTGAYSAQIQTLSSGRLIAYRRDDALTVVSANSSTTAFPLNTWESAGMFCSGAAAEFTTGTGTAAGSGALNNGTLASNSNGFLGANTSAASAITYDGQVGRIVLATTNLKGMARAKMLRWVDEYTQSL